MLGDFAREADARIEDALAELRGLAGGMHPGCAVPLQILSVVVLEPVETAGEGGSPGIVDPHGFGVPGGVALVVVQVGEGGGGSVGLFVIPDADVMGVCAGHDDHAGAKWLGPVGDGPELVFRGVRGAGGGFSAAVGAGGISGRGRVEDFGKYLPEMFGGTVDADAESAAMRALPVGAGGVAPDPGGVGLVGSAIVAMVVESICADEETERALDVFGEDKGVLAVNVAVNIHRAALVGSFLDVPVGPDDAAGGQQSPRAVVGFGDEAVVAGAFRAVAGADLSEVCCGAHGDYVDDAADGAGAVEVAGAAADHLDALDGQLWLLLPVNPVGEGVVERNVILGDEGAAGGSGAESSEAQALGGGIGDE